MDSTPYSGEFAAKRGDENRAEVIAAHFLRAS